MIGEKNQRTVKNRHNDLCRYRNDLVSAAVLQQTKIAEYRQYRQVERSGRPSAGLNSTLEATLDLTLTTLNFTLVEAWLPWLACQR